MWYKNSNSIGIRAKTGKCNQVLSFGGKSCEKDKEEMKDIGWQICPMLEKGSSASEAKKKVERLVNS